ncbi:MAG: hypothetical protein AABW72_01415 [archaeon]
MNVRARFRGKPFGKRMVPDRIAAGVHKNIRTRSDFRDNTVQAKETSSKQEEQVSRAYWEREERTRAESALSFRFNFSEHLPDLRKAIVRSLKLSPSDIAGKKLVVVAGFGGHFTNALRKLGFNVVHTDLVKEYTKGVKGVKTIAASAHKLPRISKALAYVSFEGRPAFRYVNGHLAFLKGMAETEKGILDVRADPRYGTSETVLLFSTLANTYGCIAETAKQGPFEVDALRNKGKSRDKFRVDAAVLSKMLSSKGTIYAKDVAKKLGLKESEVIRSFKRINIFMTTVNESIKIAEELSMFD